MQSKVSFTGLTTGTFRDTSQENPICPASVPQVHPACVLETVGSSLSLGFTCLLFFLKLSTCFVDRLFLVVRDARAMGTHNSESPCFFVYECAGNRNDFRPAVEIHNLNRKNRATSANSIGCFSLFVMLSKYCTRCLADGAAERYRQNSRDKY